MRGTVAKRLRREAEAETVNKPMRAWSQGSFAPGVPQQMTDSCTRIVYKRKKKQYKVPS